MREEEAGKSQEEEEEERVSMDSVEMSHEVGNFSHEEVVRYKATLKKLLATIDQTVKMQCKSLEHRMGAVLRVVRRGD